MRGFSEQSFWLLIKLCYLCKPASVCQCQFQNVIVVAGRTSVTVREQASADVFELLHDMLLA